MKVRLRFEKRINKEPSALVLDLKGEVSSGKSLEALINVIEGSDHKNYVIRLKDVHYMNSSGFGELADLHLRCQERGKRVVFADLDARIQAVFETMGGYHIFNMADTIDQAFEQFGHN